MVVLKQYFNISELEAENTTLRYAPDTSPAPIRITDLNFATTLAVDPYENVTVTSSPGYLRNQTAATTTEKIHLNAEILIMIGCGPVGIGSNFSVLYLRSSGPTQVFSGWNTVVVVVFMLFTALHI